MSKNKKFYSKKNNTKGGYKDKRSTNSRPLGKNTNNPNWYMLTESLGRLATSVNFLQPVGLDAHFSDDAFLKDSSLALTREPGVAENMIQFIPGGVSNSPISALNEAARAMFTWIRSKLMKNITRYEKTDLVIMSYAVANIFAWVIYLETCLRVLKKYTVLNRYTPGALLRALHVNSANITEFQVNLEKYLEQLVFRLDNLIVPDIPIFQECLETFKYIYIDEDIEKAQFIVNVPEYVWKFVVDPETSKGKLVRKMFSTGTNYTFSELKDFTEDLISTLLNDEDYAFMSGDIMAAYPNHIKLDKIIDTSPIEFTYSKEYLEKWHNSAQFGHITSDAVISDWEITQESSEFIDSYLVFDPVITAPNAAYFEDVKRSCGNRFLDFYDREITPQQIMVSTRWLFSLKIEDEATRKFKFFTAGSQLISRIYIHYYDNNGNLVNVGYRGFVPLSEGASSKLTVELSYLVAEMLLRKWNYSPLTIYMIDSTTVSGHEPGYFSAVGDLGNYAVVTPLVLSEINELANYTLFGATPLIQGK